MYCTKKKYTKNKVQHQEELSEYLVEGGSVHCTKKKYTENKVQHQDELSEYVVEGGVLCVCVLHQEQVH